MRSTGIWVLAAAMVFLTGCGENEPDGLEINEGESGQINLSMETEEGMFEAQYDQNDSDLPFKLSLPDDAVMINNVRLSTDETMASHTVIFTTKQSPEAMLEMYQKASESDGFEVTHNGTTRRGWLLSSRRGEKDNLRVVIEQTGDDTIVNITAHMHP